MDQPTFLFQLGHEATAQPGRWTSGKVHLASDTFDVEADFIRSGKHDFYSTHHLALKIAEPFSPELFAGILQLIGEAGFAPSVDHLFVREDSELSDAQLVQLVKVLAIWDLEIDCRDAVSEAIASLVQLKLKRISMLERIGAAFGANWNG